jgi:hypothetical protein
MPGGEFRTTRPFQSAARPPCRWGYGRVSQKGTRTEISFSSQPWDINGVPGLGQVRIIQAYQRVLEFAENRMHLLRCANGQGSKMRWCDDLTFRPEPAAAGLITLCRVEVHAKPALRSAGE